MAGGDRDSVERRSSNGQARRPRLDGTRQAERRCSYAGGVRRRRRPGSHRLSGRRRVSLAVDASAVTPVLGVDAGLLVPGDRPVTGAATDTERVTAVAADVDDGGVLPDSD